MKKLFTLSAIILLFVSLGFSQTVLFTDSFETGITNWVTTGTWGIASTQSHSPTHSLSESPTGNYTNNLSTFCTMANGVDLSTYPSASLSFWGTYKIEGGFDYMYVDVSTDNFATFTTVATYDGNESLPLPPFAQYNIDLGGFCGNNNVKVRFHFTSDQGYVTDGMYIDDFTITGSSVDNSPPLIIHTPLPYYEGSLNAMILNAQLIDFSGINVTNSKVDYTVDGGAIQSVPAVLISGNNYQFTIPTQTPGALVIYHIYAEDNYSTPNNIVSPDYKYIAGNHIIQDNGQVDFYSYINPDTTVGPSNGVSVKIVLGNTDLVGMLIRNYTDVSHPNDSMLVHVWNDNAGLPGTDVITPFMVKPSATLSNTSAMTWVDLRPYATQLSGISGTYYIGFTVPTTSVVNITMTEPGSFSRSYILIGTTWSLSTGTNGVADYHFRAITSLNQDVEGPNIANNTIPVLAEANLNIQTVSATVTDMTGVASSDLHYMVDNGSVQTVAGTSSGDIWSYSIPAQPAGAWIKYWISAVDVVTPTPYTSQTDTFTYVSGVYHKYDDGTPNVYIPVDNTTTIKGLAQIIDFGTQHTTITTMLIRNYYNTSVTLNSPMEIHIWGDNSGNVGTDLFTPFMQPSAANSINTMALTKADLRPYSAQLSNLTGLVYAGIKVPTGNSAILGDSVLSFNNAIIFNGTSWSYISNDVQIRVVTTDLITGVSSNMNDNIIDVYPNPSSSLVNVYIDKFEKTQLQIININGQVVFEKQVNENNTLLNVSSYTKGVYIIKIKNETGVSIHKLVVK